MEDGRDGRELEEKVRVSLPNSFILFLFHSFYGTWYNLGL